MSESIESNFVSMKPSVEFIDILDQYPYNRDLECKFKFNDYSIQEGDRVALFKLGWCFVKDYIVFEWAPIRSQESIHSVSFNKHILPKNTTEIYQICYISGENQLQGASSPFTFNSEEHISLDSGTLNMHTPTNFSLNYGKSLVHTNPQHPLHSSLINNETLKLREENDMLRESLKAVIAQKNTNKSYDEEIEELKNVTENLRLSLLKQESEICMLKQKIQEGGEEYKKLYLEKLKVEKKYERLKNKKEENKPNNEESEVNFDMGEFKSIPPFPFAK